MTELSNSIESEIMVLGSMLTNPKSFEVAACSLNTSDFYQQEHQVIFNALKASYENNEPVDVHLICETLKQKAELKTVGGTRYIVSVAQQAGTAVYIEEYIKDLKRHSDSRKLSTLLSKTEKLVSAGEDPKEIILFVQEELESLRKNQREKTEFVIKFLDCIDKEYLTKEPLRKSMLLEYMDETGKRTGFFPNGIVAMLAGAGGVGKSHLLAQLAISVATGTPWLDTYVTTNDAGEDKKGYVFLGLGENGDDDIQRLLYKASKKIRSDNSLIKEASKRIAPYSFCGKQATFLENRKPSQYFKELKTGLIEMAPPEGWSLIILDPISRLMGADAETDNAAATQFIVLLEELTLDLPGNPAILFAHHVNKAALRNDQGPSQADARGSSALTDGVRLQFNFAKKGNEGPDAQITTFYMTKSNFTKIIEPLETQKDCTGFIEKINKPRIINTKTNTQKLKTC